MYDLKRIATKTIILMGLGLQAIITNAVHATHPDHDHKYRIDSFEFAMGAPIGTGTAGVPVGTGPYGTINEGTYQGSSTTNALVNFQFFNVPVYVYTALVNQTSPKTPGGLIPGGPPPFIDQTAGTADMSSWFAVWNENTFIQGNSNASVVNNFDGTFTIDWSAFIPGPPNPDTNPFGGQTGYWRLEVTCLDCVPSVLEPVDKLTVTQATYTTLTVGQSDGNVVISSANGTNPANTTYDWSVSHASIVDIDADQGTFTFDPSSVPVGTYTISHTYTDTTNLPTNTNTATGRVLIRVTSDSVTNHLDSDLDGIPDSNDPVSLTAQQIQSVYTNASTYILNTDIGTIKLGDTAFCVMKGARITLSDIQNSGASNCSATTNSSDDLIKRIGVGGFFDFIITNISKGDKVSITIPLTEEIPANATYRKYSEKDGWSKFDTDSGDSIASTTATSTGVCPPPASTAYTNGLKKGDNCIRLIITDGGPNDTDGAANAQIRDPGGVAEIQSGVEANLSSGCSIADGKTGLKNHVEWLILVAFIGILAVARNRKRNTDFQA